MTGAELLAAYAKGQRDFHGEDLQNAQLDKANLNDINLEGANLAGANLQWTTLRHANLKFANLDKTDLSYTDLYQVQMGGAKVTNATNLTGATARFVDYDKSYNKVTWPMAHDSHTAMHYYNDGGMRDNVDQSQPVSGQLAGGIRVFRISSFLDDDGVRLNHGDPGFNRFYKTIFGFLDDYLTAVHEFLLANPTEFVTIIDESANLHPQIKEVYERIFGRYVAPKGANKNISEQVTPPLNSNVNLFEAAPVGTQNSDSWPWTVERLKNGQWPTLNDMLARNQRLIVFMADTPQPNDPLWMLPAYPNGCIRTSDSGNPMAGENRRPQFPGTIIDADRSTGGLYLLNHYFYSKGATFNRSDRSLNKWSVGDLIWENTLRAQWYPKAGIPNFLNVDFYNGTRLDGNVNYLLALVDACNRLSNSADALSRSAQGVRIADTRGLQIGGTYTIGNTVGGKTYNLALGTNGSLELNAADPTNESQIWQLVYNTPAPGIAFVNPHSRKRLCVSSGTLKTEDAGVVGYTPTGNDSSGFVIFYKTDDYGTDDKVWCFSTVSTPARFVSSKEDGDGHALQMADGAYGWQFTAVSQLPDVSYSVTGTPALIQRTDGRLTVVAPRLSGLQMESPGLVEINFESFPDNGATVTVIETLEVQPTVGAALIQSDYGDAGTGNLEMVALIGNDLKHFYKQTHVWHTTSSFGSKNEDFLPAGNPALIQSSFKDDPDHGNFEVVIPVQSGGFTHYWRSSQTQEWLGGTHNIGCENGPFQGIALIQRANSTDFEVVGNAADGGRLVHYSRTGTRSNFQWQFRTQFGLNVCGTPGLVQRKNGVLHVVAPISPSNVDDDKYQKGGGFVHFQFDDTQNQWKQVDGNILPTEGWFQSVSLIENRNTGNLEIVARRNTELVRYYRNDANGQWFKAPTLRGGLI